MTAAEELERALWHAGLQAKYRKPALVAGLGIGDLEEAVRSIKAARPEWFGAPRISAHDAIGYGRQAGVDYLTASREDRDRAEWLSGAEDAI